MEDNQSRIACIFLLNGDSAERVQAYAESCRRFTPTIAVRGHEAVFLEVGKSRLLFSEEGLPGRLTALARRFGFRVRVAIARDPGMALAMARSDVRGLDQLPLGRLSDLASPFTFFEDLQNRIDELALVLEKLGIQTIGQFMKIPPQEMGARFGRDAIQFGARIRGELPVAWPGFYRPQRIIEQVDFQAPPHNLEALIFGVRASIDRAMARLRGRAERASVLEIELETEDWSTEKCRKHPLRMEFPVAQGSTHGVLPLLRERLSAFLMDKPLRAPISSVKVEVLESVPGNAAQRNFFDSKEEQQESWNALVARLVQRLGEGRVFVAQVVERYLPEKAYLRTLEFKAKNQVAKLFHAARPSRLVEPTPLKLVHSQVRSWSAPERIEGEWWSEKGFLRDYYRVSVEGGRELWVYTNPSPKQSQTPYFLHGYFD